MPAWLSYSLARLALFGGVLAVLMLLGIEWFPAVLIASAVAFCVSFIFLRGQREAVALDIAERRPKKPAASSDESAEDDADDDDADPDERAAGPSSPAASSPAAGSTSERERGAES